MVKHLTKSERKLLRQQTYFYTQFINQYGIQPCDVPTRSFIIGYVGAICTITSECLEPLFRPYGTVEDIMVVPGQPLAIVIYSDIQNATQLYEDLHGAKIDFHEQFTNILIIFYAEKVPKSFELPVGLHLLHDYLSEEEETALLDLVSTDDHNSKEGELKHRKVTHYGYEFLYGSNNIDKEHPLPNKIPQECFKTLARLHSAGQIHTIPDQLTVNQYQPGQGIPPHVDTHSAFEDEIISVSLGSFVIMDFRHPSGRRLPVLLPPRSVLIMTGESRYLWSHGIGQRKMEIMCCKESGKMHLDLVPRQKRVSFTFRTIRRGECSCNYPNQCDSRIKEKSSGNEHAIKNEDAKILEKKYVYEVYEEIADHFSNTRYKPWPKIAKFLDNIPKGSLLLDIGCGNGKYLGRHSHITQIGSDLSQNLLSICKDRGLEVLQSDILDLPFRNGIADACLCIAVIHHLSTESRRLKALQNISNLLVSGGRALIYVWAFEQEKDGIFSNYIKPSKLATSQESLSVNRASDKVMLEEKSEPFLLEEHCEPTQSAFSSSSRKQKECTTSAGSKTDAISETSLQLAVHVNGTCFKQQDMLVPWHMKGSNGNATSEKTYHRFYHLFREGELGMLCKKLDNTVILESYYDKGNWCVVLQKI